MFRHISRLIVALLLVGLAGGAASAQVVVPLPDQTQTSTLTATVGEQCRITVPANIAFAVTRVSQATVAAPATVTIDNIVLSNASRQLRLSVRANAANFTPPIVGATTWNATNVSWNASAWSNGGGFAGSLNNLTFTRVFDSNPGINAAQTNNLTFTLAANPLVTRAGNHTLVMTWRVEAF